MSSEEVKVEAEVEAEEKAPESESKSMSSPYPLMIAAGLALTDIGIFSRFGSYSIFALLIGVPLLIWSVRGILIETGYIGDG